MISYNLKFMKHYYNYFINLYKTSKKIRARMPLCFFDKGTNALMVFDKGTNALMILIRARMPLFFYNPTLIKSAVSTFFISLSVI
jgi:hypothetical protein